MANAHREALPVRPERVVPCIPRAVRPAVPPEVRVPASASAPAALDAPVSVSVPVRVERAVLCRLPAKRRARIAQAPTRAVAASSIPRPKKAP